MSADNCVAILQTTDKFKQINPYLKNNMYGKQLFAWRVAHIQAIDSFEWYEQNEPHNLGVWLNSVFGRAHIFYSETEAIKFATDLLASIEYTEYGLCRIDATKYNFPGY